MVSTLAGCAMLLASFGSQGAAAQERKVTVWPSPDWQAASPEGEGMDSEALAGLVVYGRTLSFDSLLIARHGRLVLDAYYAPYSADMPHAVNSTTTTGRDSCPLGTLADAISGAVRSDTAPPASPEATASLAAAIREISTSEFPAAPGAPEKQ
jgi:hypothetical protein